MVLSWRRLIGIALGLIVGGGVLWGTRRGAHSKETGSTSPEKVHEQHVPSVEVIRPRQGGIPRTIQQPASIYSFETVDLYAMVSGYLKTQEVDIGSRVKKGQVLAEINVPRDAKAVEEAVSLVEQARTRIVQAEAQVKMAEAQRDAAAAAAKVAESERERLVARRNLAEKQVARINGLVAERATTSRVADEQRSDLDAALAAERTGTAEIQSAKAKLVAAVAAVEQAKADAMESRANLAVAEARRDRLKVNLDYAKIVAPFDGVVTQRSFHPGALIRSATEAVQQPLLTVKRIDLMRVVVLVPDRDVVLTKVGDSVVVSVDALGGRSFKGVLARVARAEDAERMMRVEIDLPNPENVLCDGMYGKAIINLERNPSSLVLPATCVVEHSGRAGGVVFVVRAGRARRTAVQLGGDNGSEVEILSGLRPDDTVVRPAGTPLEDGMRVVATH
ncbi:MAG: efflux RND transporter periplasmic adaptor subunit [Isosphaeraceae bacterium]